MDGRCSLFYLVLSLKELHWDNEIIGSRTCGGRGPFLFSWNYFIRVAASSGCCSLSLQTMREGNYYLEVHAFL